MAAKALHIVLVITVFFSTTGFTLRKHYCKAAVEDKACLKDLAMCSDSSLDLSADSESGNCNAHHCDDDCCQSFAKYYQLDEEKQAQSVNFEFLKKPALVHALLVVYNYSFPTNEVLKPPHLNYKPPIVQEDIQVLLQTFLL